MIKHSVIFLLLILLNLTFQVSAQKKKMIQPGKLYEAGETLYAPKYGLIAKVPNGWEGLLPRESEVFLLSSTTNTYGEIFVFGAEKNDLHSIKSNWMNGFNLSESIKLKGVNPVINGEILSGEIAAEGDFINNEYKAFAVARCGPTGACVTALMHAPAQFYESVKTATIELMNAATFEKPSSANPYEDFDWQEFLSGKMFATYASARGGSKETVIHLCKDGTFAADIQKSGFFKEQNPAYKGKLTGEWKVKGDGENALLQFTFSKKKLSPVEVPILIKDEKIISNGERFFVGNSDKCK